MGGEARLFLIIYGGDYLKSKKVKLLLDAIQEADYKVSETLTANGDKLIELIEHFLYIDDGNPLRIKLKNEYEQGSITITGFNGIRKKLAVIDMEFFGRAYFPHYFSRKSPEFHKELDDIWLQGVMKSKYPTDIENAKSINEMIGKKRVVAAPRGHAKSTTLTFKGVMHAVLYEYKHYPIILSGTTEQAEGFLDSIKMEFEENSELIEDFGDLCGTVWRSNVILTKSNIKVEALGSGKKIRGRKHRNWRPDLIIVDDVENDENIRTLEQRNKLESWFLKAVSKAGDDYTDIICIGTLLHYDSLLAHILKNPAYQAIKYKAVISFATHTELWDEWEKIYTELDNPNREQEALFYFEQNKKKMLKDTNVLWKEKNSYYDLMIMKVSDGESAFHSELQNEPINPEDCLFMEEWFDFYNESEIDFKDGNFSFFGFIDPSLGKSKRSDFSAIITLAKNKVTGYMYVLDADIERRHPDRIILDTLEKEIWLKKTYGKGYKKLGAETNQFQWFLKEELAKASAKAGLYLPIEEVGQTSDKIMRIQTLQPDIKNKYIKFNKRHKRLLEQLYHFPMASHDDGADALEGCRTIAKKSKSFKTLDKNLLGL